jgi:hypothetical protein
MEASMSMQITLEGTVKADGTLELDDKVAMPEGRVLVTVQPVVQPAPDDPFWTLMEGIWAGQRARGHVARTREQIDAEIDELRIDADAELHAIERMHEEGRPHRGSSGSEEVKKT